MASSRSYRNVVNTSNGTAKPLSLVQQRARQFEALAQSSEVKAKECNWWLSDFKNLADNSCECEPCENRKSLGDSDVISEKFVDKEEQVDDVQVEIVEEADQYEENDEESVFAKESASGDEKLFTNDDEIEDDVTPANHKVVEAMNSNVHGVKVLQTDVEDAPFTDEE